LRHRASSGAERLIQRDFTKMDLRQASLRGCHVFRPAQSNNAIFAVILSGLGEGRHRHETYCAIVVTVKCGRGNAMIAQA
jgi:hypothetical protein